MEIRLDRLRVIHSFRPCEFGNLIRRYALVVLVGGLHLPDLGDLRLSHRLRAAAPLAKPSQLAYRWSLRDALPGHDHVLLVAVRVDKQNPVVHLCGSVRHQYLAQYHFPSSFEGCRHYQL